MMSMATMDRANDEFKIFSYNCICKIHCYLFLAETTHLIQYVHCMHKTYCEGCAGQATLCGTKE